MAIRVMEIPECDVCGELTLPNKGPGRENPREFHKRCGKCKNPRWDWKYKAQQAAAQAVLDTAAIDPPKSSAPEPGESNKPCRHRKLNCPICHP